MSNSKPPVFDEFYAAANSYCSFYMREQRCRRSMPNNVRLYAGKVFGSHAENMVAVRVPTNTGNVYVRLAARNDRKGRLPQGARLL
jgi:hypothetical protein